MSQACCLLIDVHLCFDTSTRETSCSHRIQRGLPGDITCSLPVAQSAVHYLFTFNYVTFNLCSFLILSDKFFFLLLVEISHRVLFVLTSVHSFSPV